MNDNTDELRGPDGSYLQGTNGMWNEYTTTLTAPATVDALYFEVRTYSGATVLGRHARHLVGEPAAVRLALSAAIRVAVAAAVSAAASLRLAVAAAVRVAVAASAHAAASLRLA